MSNSVRLIYNVIVLIKDREWLQIFNRFLFWTFDERPYSCRKKLNISWLFQTFVFFHLFFFCLNRQNRISRIVYKVGNLNTKFFNRKNRWLEQLKHLPICCQNILCQFKSLLKSIKILSPQVKKIYEVLPKSINREIDEKEWKCFNVHLLLILKDSSKATLCITCI